MTLNYFVLYLFISSPKQSVNFKYKSKYRSLVFNIRDTKNGGLFRQILTSAVTPQKLATMTSDEMASKELAEWRQREGKKVRFMLLRFILLLENCI